MANAPLDRWIDRFVARVRLGEFLQRAAETGAIFLFVFGGIVLTVKLLAPRAWPNVLWLGLGLGPAWGLAWWLAGRRLCGRWESVARLDSALEAGGLLMMLSELPDDEWAKALPQVDRIWHEALPRLRPRRFVRYLGLPLLFAAGACFVPLREGTSAILRNTVGQQAAQELESLLSSIEKEDILDEEEKKELREEIEKIAEETRETPLTHEKWEAVDALRERMQVRLESAAMIALQAGEAAALLSASERGPELSLERVEQLEAGLGQALQKLIKKGAFAGAPQDLQEQLARLLKNGKLQLPEAAADRQELLDELKDFLDEESRRLEELREKCAACRGQCDADGECEGLEALGESNSQRPGRGGVTRGRGDAELTWGDEADKQGTKFKEVVLPKGLLDRPKDEIIAIQRVAPNEEAAATAPRSGRRDDESAAGQATWNRRLSPRHRNAVRKYFDTAKEK